MQAINWYLDHDERIDKDTAMCLFTQTQRDQNKDVFNTFSGLNFRDFKVPEQINFNLTVKTIRACQRLQSTTKRSHVFNWHYATFCVAATLSCTSTQLVFTHHIRERVTAYYGICRGTRLWQNCNSCIWLANSGIYPIFFEGYYESDDLAELGKHFNGSDRHAMVCDEMPFHGRTSARSPC